MKIKKGFILQQLGDEHVVIAIGEAGKNFSGMMKMNDVGAYIWNKLLTETTEAEIINEMVKDFEDLDKETAESDLKDFLEQIKIALE